MGKDARTGRVQSVKLTRNFYAQDLHKSMFINDLCISLPKYYAVSWPTNVTVEHKRGQRWKDIDILYKPPRSSEESGHRVFKGKVHLLASKGRGQFSSYRLHWGKWSMGSDVGASAQPAAKLGPNRRTGRVRSKLVPRNTHKPRSASAC